MVDVGSRAHKAGVAWYFKILLPGRLDEGEQDKRNEGKAIYTSAEW